MAVPAKSIFAIELLFAFFDINAKTISTERKIEKEDLILTINFGLFFYEKKNTSKGLELSKYYKTEIPEKTNEKFYSLNNYRLLDF